MTMIEYLAKYPWLKITDYDGEQYCALENLPDGWVGAFGEMMCEEIDNALRHYSKTVDSQMQKEFHVVQAKEKYGSMRLYCNYSIQEIEDIITKYEVISENTCMICGKPDTPMLNIGGWLSTYCEDCFKNINTTKTYQEVSEKKSRIDNSVIIRSYSMKAGNTERTIEVVDTANKIREHYLERIKNAK